MTVAEEVIKRLRTLTIATGVLFVALLFLSTFVLVTSANQRDRLTEAIENTNGSLCTFRNDLQQQVNSSVEFLEANPKGIAGISPDVIQQNIDNQRNTIEALSDLDCGPI